MTEVEIAYVASAVVMGVVLVGIAVILARSGHLRPSPVGGEGDRAETAVDSFAAAARNPDAWTLAFGLATVATTASVLLYVGDFVPEASRQIVGLAVAGILSVALTTFLFVGTYLTARSKGRSTAWGVAEGITALGLLFILAIVGTLVVG